MEDQYHLIDRYLLGELNSEELKTFEQQLKMDQQLANQVEEQRKAMQLLEIVRDNKMKENLKNIHTEVRGEQEAKTRSLPGRRKFLIGLLSGAAAVLLLIVGYNAFFNMPIQQELYETYYQTYPVSLAARSENPNPDLAQAIQLYQQKNYAQALTQLQKLDSLQQEKIIPLTIGLCHLELENFQSAILPFQTLLNDPLYQEPAQWYLALAHLKTEENEKCSNLLMDIKNNSEFYQQAQSLLKKLPKSTQ